MRLGLAVLSYSGIEHATTSGDLVAAGDVPAEVVLESG